MDVVKISVNKLDTLAQTVSTKSGEELPLTLDEMNTAVANIQTGGGGGTMQEKSVSYTPTESAQTDVVTPSSGFDGLSKVNVSVGAIDSEYVGSSVPRKSSTDLTASGGTVSVPSGFYESNASKAVQTGTEGTPTATKGTVSNHAIAVTPSVTNAEGYISGNTKTGTAVSVSASEVTSGNKAITSNGNNIDVVNYATVSVNVPSQGVTLQTKSKTYTPTESQQTDTITADTGYDGLDEVDVTVDAISSSYVGSGIDRKDSTDLTASGATVTAPAGYYESSATKTVASGSATTPATTITANPTISVSSSGLITASVSASQSITPTVSAGYVTSGTSGTVTASGSKTEQLTARTSSDLTVSGATVTAPAGYYNSSASKSVSSMTLPSATSSSHTGTAKATISRSTSAQYLNIPTGYNSTAQYYTVSAVPNGTEGTPTATKGTVSNHSVSVTPSVTNSEGYISGGTKTGTAVSVSASELVSGSETKTANGTYDVTTLAQLIVNVSGGGSSGLEYETGTWTPESDTASEWISFSKAHTTPPFFYAIWDATDTYDSTNYTNQCNVFFQADHFFGSGIKITSTTTRYGYMGGWYRNTSATGFSNFSSYTQSAWTSTGTTQYYPAYWVSTTGIRANQNSTSRYWRANRTYKWLAIWAPTT